MLNQIDYEELSSSEAKQIFGSGAELGMGLVAAFGVIAIVSIVIYKIYGSKTADISLPGGFKFKFTT